MHVDNQSQNHSCHTLVPALNSGQKTHEGPQRLSEF